MMFSLFPTVLNSLTLNSTLNLRKELSESDENKEYTQPVIRVKVFVTPKTNGVRILYLYLESLNIRHLLKKKVPLSLCT